MSIHEELMEGKGIEGVQRKHLIECKQLKNITMNREASYKTLKV